jgi:hypothetical protein
LREEDVFIDWLTTASFKKVVSSMEVELLMKGNKMFTIRRLFSKALNLFKPDVVHV